MLYTTLGSLFLIIFGIEIGYKYLWLEVNDNWAETEPLIGQPIKFNLSGHIIPVVNIQFIINQIAVEKSVYSVITILLCNKSIRKEKGEQYIHL